MRYPAYHIIVFGVDHNERTFARDDCEYVEQPVVVDLQCVVGYETLNELMLERIRSTRSFSSVVASVADRI